MKTIIYFIRFFFINVGTIPSIIKYNRLSKKESPKKTADYLYKITTAWAAKLFNNSGATVTLNHLDNIPDGNFLLVSNHQGNFDIPLLMSNFPKMLRFIAKIELKKVPIISGWMQRMGCVFLDRSKLRQSMNILKEVSEELKNDKTYVLFPEGTRSKGPTMNEFKKGSLRIAVKSGVPILPITINGTYKLFEEHYKINPHPVSITIHEPIQTANLSREEEKALSDKVFNIIQSAL